MKHYGTLWNITPGHHPFLDGILPNKNHSAMGDPPFSDSPVRQPFVETIVETVDFTTERPRRNARSPHDSTPAAAAPGSAVPNVLWIAHGIWE